MSSKKAQKINPLAKPNGSQTSTPNGGNADENESFKGVANNNNSLQMNPQQQMINGIPSGNMNMMNSMNFNPNFRNNVNGATGRNQAAAAGNMPNSSLHPQQLAALQAQAQAHYATMQQNDPNRNNPQYQQYLQQLQQQNQMYMQMQNQQQLQQGPQGMMQNAQGFQGPMPQQQQQVLPQQHFQGQGQPPNQQQQPNQQPNQQQQQQQQQHPTPSFQYSQSQQPTPHQQHPTQPPQSARPPQQPTPQQSHPTQAQPTSQQQPQSATAPTHPMNQPTPQQQPQQQPPNPQQGPKQDPKLTRMPSTAGSSAAAAAQQRMMMANRGGIQGMAGGPQQGPLGTQGSAIGNAQGAAQAAQAAQSGMNQGTPTHNGSNGMNPAIMNAMNFRRQMSNLATLKFLDFCELIGVRTDSTKNILYWRKIITDYFSEVGVLRYSVKSGVDSRQFEFSVPIIPRFFFSIIQSGVTRMEIQPGLLRSQVLANGTTYLESSRCCFTHYYPDGSYVNIHGNIRGILNQQLKMDWLDFQTHVFIPGVEWPSLEKLLSDEQKVQEIFANKDQIDNSDTKRLQLLSKFRSNYKVFHSMSNFGLQESVMRVMQVSDVMAHLKSLMLFSITSPEPTGPLNALDTFVSQSLARNQKKDSGDQQKNQQQQQQQSNQTNVKDEKQSPLNMAQSPMTRTGKAPPLDISQSTLTKRRRKSTIDNGLSPKSTADSPKPTPTGNGKSNKKAKR